MHTTYYKFFGPAIKGVGGICRVLSTHNICFGCEIRKVIFDLTVPYQQACTHWNFR